jgi:hypothetical protein
MAKHEALEETNSPKPSDDTTSNVKKPKNLGDGKASIAGSVFNLANAVCINTNIFPSFNSLSHYI